MLDVILRLKITNQKTLSVRRLPEYPLSAI